MSSKVVKEEEEKDVEVAKITKPSDRLFTVRWEGIPVEFKRVKDRSEPKGYKIIDYCLIPFWLRDLWPAHDFDPIAIWENEKLNRASNEDQSIGGKSSKADKAKKTKVPSKKEQIQAENARKLQEELEQKDLEKLKNSSGKSQRQMLFSIKMVTPYGELTRLLEILNDVLETKDKRTAYDVFWAIESLPLYKSAIAEEDKIKIIEKEESKKDKKKDSKEKDKKSSKSPTNIKRSRECQLVGNYKKSIKKILKLREEEEDMIKFQLTEMADRLPPLSRFSTGWKLDDWQTRVLQVVDEGASAIVCAPTSSGKTIISSYAVSQPRLKRILFVVPTEPLAWQVAALFHKIIKGNVALCMGQDSFRSDASLRVIVGTPLSVETALSKLCGPVGAEVNKKLDYSEMQGGFSFDYAIFDEVHSLDGEEGEALQRLIRGIRCNFLAMSATIGNASQLLSWWQEVKKEQIQDISIIESDNELLSDPILLSPDIHLEEHSGRFINLQRMVWMGEKNNFEILHPLSVISMNMLQSDTGLFSGVSLPFTPADTYALWLGMVKHFPLEKINHLSPSNFFSQYKDSDRITLHMSKEYESFLCKLLENLARELPTETQKLLDMFTPGDVSASVDVTTAVGKIKNSDLSPAIMFHLDSFKCLTLFKDLLHSLEMDQRQKYPNYINELQQKAEELDRIRAQAAKRRVANAKEEEENARDFADLEPTNEFIDTAAPHPDFILSSPTIRISNKEYEDIKTELSKELKNPGHPFLRALRRGFGIYIDDGSFPKYRRVVQRLAQQAKLAFVFSDESLAYGVNMPFRSCCFCDSMDGLLTPLLAQQMSGRAGRRGLDTQGNLLYMNMSWPRIQHLMLGTIPAIIGREPRYPTISLLPALSKIALSEPFPPYSSEYRRKYSRYVDDYMARRMVGKTLKQHINNEEMEEEYFETSLCTMKSLGFLDEIGDVGIKYARTLCIATWELRGYLPESVALPAVMDLFFKIFAENKPKDYAESPAIQIEFCGLLFFVIDRIPQEEGTLPFQELPHFQKSPGKLNCLKQLVDLLKEHHNCIHQLPEAEKLRLPIPLDDPIDSRIFSVFQSNSLTCLGTIDSLTRYELAKRLRKIGCILKVLHDVLMIEAPYNELEMLLRKSFMRVKYIISDSLLEESKLEDVSDLESKLTTETEN